MKLKAGDVFITAPFVALATYSFYSGLMQAPKEFLVIVILMLLAGATWLSFYTTKL